MRSITSQVATRSSSERPVAAPLLDNKEFILHPLQALRQRKQRPGVFAGHDLSVATGKNLRCAELHVCSPPWRRKIENVTLRPTRR
jgi:hypothetical protein